MSLNDELREIARMTMRCNRNHAVLNSMLREEVQRESVWIGRPSTKRSASAGIAGRGDQHHEKNTRHSVESHHRTEHDRTGYRHHHYHDDGLVPASTSPFSDARKQQEDAATKRTEGRSLRRSHSSGGGGQEYRNSRRQGTEDVDEEGEALTQPRRRCTCRQRSIGIERRQQQQHPLSDRCPICNGTHDRGLYSSVTQTEDADESASAFVSRLTCTQTQTEQRQQNHRTAYPPSSTAFVESTTTSAATMTPSFATRATSPLVQQAVVERLLPEKPQQHQEVEHIERELNENARRQQALLAGLARLEGKVSASEEHVINELHDLRRQQAEHIETHHHNDDGDEEQEAGGRKSRTGSKQPRREGSTNSPKDSLEAGKDKALHHQQRKDEEEGFEELRRRTENIEVCVFGTPQTRSASSSASRPTLTPPPPAAAATSAHSQSRHSTTTFNQINVSALGPTGTTSASSATDDDHPRELLGTARVLLHQTQDEVTNLRMEMARRQETEVILKGQLEEIHLAHLRMLDEQRMAQEREIDERVRAAVEASEALMRAQLAEAERSRLKDEEEGSSQRRLREEDERKRTEREEEESKERRRRKELELRLAEEELEERRRRIKEDEERLERERIEMIAQRSKQLETAEKEAARLRREEKERIQRELDEEFRRRLSEEEEAIKMKRKQQKEEEEEARKRAALESANRSQPRHDDEAAAAATSQALKQLLASLDEKMKTDRETLSAQMQSSSSETQKQLQQLAEAQAAQQRAIQTLVESEQRLLKRSEELRGALDAQQGEQARALAEQREHQAKLLEMHRREKEKRHSISTLSDGLTTPTHRPNGPPSPMPQAPLTPDVSKLSASSQTRSPPTADSRAVQVEEDDNKSSAAMAVQTSIELLEDRREETPRARTPTPMAQPATESTMGQVVSLMSDIRLALLRNGRGSEAASSNGRNERPPVAPSPSESQHHHHHDTVPDYYPPPPPALAKTLRPVPSKHQAPPSRPSSTTHKTSRSSSVSGASAALKNKNKHPIQDKGGSYVDAFNRRHNTNVPSYLRPTTSSFRHSQLRWQAEYLQEHSRGERQQQAHCKKCLKVMCSGDNCQYYSERLHQISDDDDDA